MTDYAKAQWVPSPNFSPNRDGHNPTWTAADPTTWIVLHTMVGTESAARARFMNPAQQASAHYGVCLDGRVIQYVAEKDAAWTNGSYADNPGSNLDSITIEHEDDGDYNGPRTPALYEASAQLVADIHRRRGIPLVHRGAGGGVLGHKECGPSGQATGCPDGLDVNGIIARANAILAGVPSPVFGPGTGGVSAPVQTVTPAKPVPGVVFDTADNDRSFLDYTTVAYVMGQIATIGEAVSWDKAKLVTEPSTGKQKWLNHITGTTWALWDDCIDDGGFDPPHFAPPPPAPAPAPIPPAPTPAPPAPIPVPVPPPPLPIPAPIPTPPAPVPPAPQPDLTGWQRLLADLFAWLKKWFGAQP